MAGMKFTISTADAQRSSKLLRQELKLLGHSADTDEKEFKKLESRLHRGMGAEKAKVAVDHLRSSLKLTRIETARLQAKTGNYSGALKTMTARTDSARAGLSKMYGVVGALAGAYGVQLLAKKSLAAFSVMDSGLIAVQKTTNMTDKELKIMEASIKKMASTIPVSTKHLLDIAAAAGQMGVKGVKDITAFTKTLGKLELATDIIGEEGAKKLARLLNVTGEAMSEIVTLGSVFVALGNDSAATEAEILSLATEIGQSTSTFAVTSKEAAGLAAAMKSLGVRSELGGSVVGRAMRSIEDAINAGGASMQLMMTTTQMTEEQLRKTFDTNATIVFQRWLSGIGRMVKGSDTAKTALKKFGLGGEELLKVLPTMANRSDILAESLRLVAKETKNATALDIEALKASKSFASQMKLTTNVIDQIAGKIGAELAPEIVGLTTDFRDWVGENDDLIKQKIPEYIGGITTSVKSLVGFLDTINIGNMAGGYIGYKLFGPQIGITLFAAATLSDALEKMQKNMGKPLLPGLPKATGFLNRFSEAVVGFFHLASGGNWSAEIKEGADEFSNAFANGPGLINPVTGALDELIVSAKELKQVIATTPMSPKSFLSDTPSGLFSGAAGPDYAKQSSGVFSGLPLSLEYGNSLDAIVYKSEEATNAISENWTNMNTAMADSFETGLSNLFVNGLDDMGSAMKEFGNMIVESFSRSVAQMVTEWLFFTTLTSGKKVAGGVVGAGLSAIGNIFTTPVAHSGWHVGNESPPATRAVDPSIFDGARRFHNGLAGDEFTAILKKGEHVIPEGGAAVPAISINIVNKGAAVDAEVSGPRMDMGQMVWDILLTGQRKGSPAARQLGMA